MAAGRSDIIAGGAAILLYTKEQWEPAFKRAEARLTSFGRQVQRVGLWLGGLGGAVALGLEKAARLFQETGNSLDRMSERTGLSGEFLSGFRYAAEEVGAEFDDLEGRLRRLALVATKASLGSKEEAKIFQRLGVAFADAEGRALPMEELFLSMGDALSRLTNETQRAGMSTAVFGRSGTALLPLFEGGREGLAAMMERGRRQGLVFSAADIAQAKEMDRAWNRMKLAMEMGVMRAGQALGPILARLVEELRKGATWLAEFVREHPGAVEGLWKIARGAFVAGLGLVAVGQAIKLLAWPVAALRVSLGLLAPALGFLLLNPFGVALAQAGILVGAYAYVNDSLRGVFGAIGRGWQTVKEDAELAAQGVVDAWSTGDIELAMKITWDGIKVEWERGVNVLSQLWYDLRAAVVQVGQDLVNEFGKIWRTIGNSWASTVGFMQRRANEFVAGLAAAEDWIRYWWRGGPPNGPEWLDERQRAARGGEMGAYAGVLGAPRGAAVQPLVGPVTEAISGMRTIPGLGSLPVPTRRQVEEYLLGLEDATRRRIVRAFNQAGNDLAGGDPFGAVMDNWQAETDAWQSEWKQIFDAMAQTDFARPFIAAAAQAAKEGEAAVGGALGRLRADTREARLARIQADYEREMEDLVNSFWNKRAPDLELDPLWTGGKIQGGAQGTFNPFVLGLLGGLGSPQERTARATEATARAVRIMADHDEEDTPD